jgi:hypothetical protein
MPEIIVRVLTDGEFVECVRRRREPLTHGRGAISYAGWLYPLRTPGPHIEVSGERLPLEELASLESGAPVTHTMRLYVDCSGGRARLMVDGDSVVRDFVATTLDDANVSADVDYDRGKPADNGRRYDWSFEFDKDDLAAELKHSLDLLAIASGVSPDPADPSPFSTLESSSGGLTSANVLVAQAGPKQIHDRLKAQATGGRKPSDVCCLVTGRFRDLLSMNITRGSRKDDSAVALDIAAWRQRVANGPRITEELLEDLHKVEQKANRLTQDVAALTQERDRLQLRVVKKLSAASVLTQVFPEIEFVRDSEAVIDEDFSSFKSLGSVLKAIVNNSPETRLNPIRGRRHDWFEIHVSTGSRDNGRIYFHRVTPLKVQVLVSFKVDQKQDTVWIRSLP